jgi:hypothetical protein
LKRGVLDEREGGREGGREIEREGGRLTYADVC